MFKLNAADKETVDEVFAETSLSLDDFLERALVRIHLDLSHHFIH